MTIEQFKSEYVVAEIDGPLETKCWVHCNKPNAQRGYVWMERDGVRHPAHLFAALDARIFIPSGHQCDHRCENKECCNPYHLDIRSARDHVRRHASKITHCPKGHEYTEENTFITEYTTKEGYHKVMRNCRQCRKDRFVVINKGRRKDPHYKGVQKAAHDRWRERNKEKINQRQLARYHARQAAYKASLDSAPKPADDAVAG